MKKYILFLITLFTGILLFSQNKNAKATIEVDGVCLMCKARIEKSAIRTKGVKSATWNMDTHELQLIFDERKTNLKTISKNIANVGHDTKLVKAENDTYKNLHPCCKYRDEDIDAKHK